MINQIRWFNKMINIVVNMQIIYADLINPKKYKF